MRLMYIFWMAILLTLAQVDCLAKDKKTYAMSMKIFKKMEEAQLLVEEENYVQALEDLNELLESKSSSYEKAQILSLIGSIKYRQGDQDGALQSFTRVLDSVGKMPVLLHQQTLKTLAQLNMARDNYQVAKEYCQQLVEIAEVPSQHDYALLAQANYKTEDWQSAVDASLTGRKIALEQEKDPNENLLLLLNAAYFEMEALTKMPDVLEELIKYYPKTSYVLYLASIYGQLDRLDKQTVLMEALYEEGKITEQSQLRNLASLYMSEKAPYKGAVLLEKALASEQLESNVRNYQLLAQAWRLAAERKKAIDALGVAAELSEDGQNDLQKAYLHFDIGQWKQANDALLAGLDKGLEGKNQGEAWLLLGMTRFKLKQYDRAIEACEKAQNHENSAKHAKQWITYISSEKRKIESMKAVGM